MAKSLGSFRAALLIGWGVLGLTGMLYARSRGIPYWAALPVLAAFLIEYPFYLAPGFRSVRERVGQSAVLFFALGAAVVPYLACCCGAVAFTWGGLARVVAVALALSLWYRVFPSSPLTDVGYLALWAAVLLGRFFNPVFTPLHPEFRDLKNVIVIPHLSMICISAMALIRQRDMNTTGFGFVPNRREWRIGALHFLYFAPIGLALVLGLHASHFARPKPAWYIAATFLGLLWVASLSEEFFVRGVLQQWIEDWTSSRDGALFLTSAIFGLLHLWLGGFPNWKWALVAGVLGYFCGRARNQAGSIRASMVTHALVATTWRAFFA